MHWGSAPAPATATSPSQQSNMRRRPWAAAGEFWTWCPASQGSEGCEVAGTSPTALPQTVAARGCLLSYDGTQDQVAYFAM